MVMYSRVFDKILQDGDVLVNPIPGPGQILGQAQLALTYVLDANVVVLEAKTMAFFWWPFITLIIATSTWEMY